MNISFSIIMLNTDLHNPAIADERRMTKPGFRRQVARRATLLLNETLVHKAQLMKRSTPMAAR